MKRFLLNQARFLLIVMGLLGFTTNILAQPAVDQTGTFDPPLTGEHLLYFEMVFYDANENGNFDAVFSLSNNEIVAWGDAIAEIVFYGTGGGIGIQHQRSRQIIPVPGELMKLWMPVDVPNNRFSLFVQTSTMDAPQAVYDGYVNFYGDDHVSELTRWTAYHNSQGEPDYLEVSVIDFLPLDDNALLSALSANVGQMSPEFNAEVLSYDLVVPYGTSSITVSPIAAGMGASIDIFNSGTGELMPATGVIPFEGDGVDLEITVTAMDGTEITYFMFIFVDEGVSDATLRDIELSSGILEPNFSRDVTSYTAYVPNGSSSVTVTGIPNFPEATVTGGGELVLSDGAATATIVVNSQDGSASKSYTVNVVEEPFELVHSYRFDSGTAADAIGDAHGEVNGGVISEGRFTTTVNGEFIELPASKIGIYNYRIVTLEAYFIAGQDNPYHTMMAYFGNTNAGNNYGNDYYYLSATNDNSSRTALSIGQHGSPWAADIDVRGDKLDDGMAHHIVSTLTRDSISLYVDGVYAGSAALPESHKVQNIGRNLAYLGKSGYTGDQTWRGSLVEFNIYNGIMDATTVALRSTAFPVYDVASNATLSEVLVDGVELEGFAPHILSYVIDIDDTVTEVPEVLAAATNTNSTVVINPAESLPGITTIVVTSENGEYSTTYKIEFYNAEADASLSEIVVDGDILEDFDPAVTEYVITLPFGTTEVPLVTATTRNLEATMVITEATELPGVTTIEVTAENGINIKTYTIEFELAEEVVDPDPSNSIFEEETSGVVVYPTVTNGSFNVVSETAINSITVFDLSGRVIARYQNVGNETSIAVQNAGVYVLMVETGSKTEMFKVVKTN
ncbi:cadherin-like beta sandwich domain-containing protein [Alkalitalea saponilacus]|uniref:Por secretion system C-terminal sorting domain-containing protein n=1 Tax=Alkalitalea saponilacus TaxID=889453 RepID=A0A1T5CH32_9BACT|nr:cadherin-like beta sandwich domain-containing protein [Alkalitalea saponilacus]ASB49864.1 hypothetical protein CDL62_12320 [Alkalitalea saponilacus]SKB58653.1 Por secretion system C-terminal sorting domain-containing protein [Alkalitalea saponilacus]